MFFSDPVNFFPIEDTKKQPLLNNNEKFDDTTDQTLEIASSNEIEKQDLLLDSSSFLSFTKRSLFTTAAQLIFTIGLACLLKATVLPGSFLHPNHLLDEVLGTNFLLLWSTVICLCLGWISGAAGSFPANCIFTAIFTFMMAYYIGLQGVFTPFMQERLYPLGCLCYPLQILGLGLYAVIKKTKITYINMLIPNLLSLPLSFLIVHFDERLEVRQRLEVIGACFLMQISFVRDFKSIMIQRKSSLGLGGYVQSIMAAYIAVYKIYLGIAAVLYVLSIVNN